MDIDTMESLLVEPIDSTDSQIPVEQLMAVYGVVTALEAVTTGEQALTLVNTLRAEPCFKKLEVHHKNELDHFEELNDTTRLMLIKEFTRELTPDYNAALESWLTDLKDRVVRFKNNITDVFKSDKLAICERIIQQPIVISQEKLDTKVLKGWYMNAASYKQFISNYTRLGQLSVKIGQLTAGIKLEVWMFQSKQTEEQKAQLRDMASEAFRRMRILARDYHLDTMGLTFNESTYRISFNKLRIDGFYKQEEDRSLSELGFKTDSIVDILRAGISVWEKNRDMVVKEIKSGPDTLYHWMNSDPSYGFNQYIDSIVFNAQTLFTVMRALYKLFHKETYKIAKELE